MHLTREAIASCKLDGETQVVPMHLKFTVPAVPVAQPRQRHRIVAGAAASFVQNYTPSKHPVQAFKSTVRLAARQAYAGGPSESALGLVVVFVMPRPGRLIWKKRAMPRCLHQSKPDLDNLVKAVKDSLNGLLWRDDGQIAHLNVSKVYAAGDEQPCVEIEVSTLEEFAATPTNASCPAACKPEPTLPSHPV